MNTIRGGVSSIMGDRYVISDEKKTIFYIDATDLYGQSMSQPLPFDEKKFERNVCLEVVINTAYDSDIDYF